MKPQWISRCLMFNLYKKIENIWFKINEKIRFVLVGGFNTVIAYLAFIFIYHIIGINYNAALITQYLITVNISFLTMRYYVFQSHGDLGKEFLKTWLVYIQMFFVNAAILNFLVIVLMLGPILSQGLYLCISTILTYILHRNFSFRKSKQK